MMIMVKMNLKDDRGITKQAFTLMIHMFAKAACLLSFFYSLEQRTKFILCRGGRVEEKKKQRWLSSCFHDSCKLSFESLKNNVFIYMGVSPYVCIYHMPNIPECWIELLKKEKRQKIQN